jgi:hypothetical protein
LEGREWGVPVGEFGSKVMRGWALMEGWRATVALMANLSSWVGSEMAEEEKKSNAYKGLVDVWTLTGVVVAYIDADKVIWERPDAAVYVVGVLFIRQRVDDDASIAQDRGKGLLREKRGVFEACYDEGRGQLGRSWVDAYRRGV